MSLSIVPVSNNKFFYFSYVFGRSIGLSGNWIGFNPFFYVNKIVEIERRIDSDKRNCSVLMPEYRFLIATNKTHTALCPCGTESVFRDLDCLLPAEFGRLSYP